MDYMVTHGTRFAYDGPVYESLMEVRLAPRADAAQDVLSFDLTTTPAAAIFGYVDALGNDVRHFDIVDLHQQLVVEATMRVRTSPARELPNRLEASAWETLDRLRADGQLWDFFAPSPRVPVSPAIRAFAEERGLARGSDPLTCCRRIVSAVHSALIYASGSTTVDTPVEAVLEVRRGVCQDFSHVALAIARTLGIPSRYVGGYLAPSGEPGGGQRLMTHAWVEAWLPGLEWTALDPTHDIAAGERHIRVAVGRDYSDAAPTRGVFRGGPAGVLTVWVRIEREGGDAISSEMRFPPPSAVTSPPPAAATAGQQ